MAELGELLLRVKSTFDGAGFQKALDASQQLEKKTKDVRQVLNTAGLALGGFAAGAAGALILSTKATLAQAEAIDKMAKQTGIAAERMQALGFAAEQEHASSEALAASLVRLSRNIFDISQGAGTEAKRAFDAMGVSVLDASGNMRTADDVMLDLAQAMSENKNQTENAAVAMATLGRGGKELIPFLIQGRTEIEKQADELRKLGGIIGEDTVKRYEKLGDELTATGRGFKGIGISVASEFLPVVERVAANAKELITAFNGLPPGVKSFAAILGIAGTAAAGLTSGLLLVIANLPKLQRAMDGAKAAADLMGASLRALSGIQLGMIGAAAAAVLAIAAIDRASRKAAEAQDLLGEALVRIGERRDKNIDLLRRTQVAGEKLNDLTYEELKARRLALEQLKMEGFVQGTSIEEMTRLSNKIRDMLPLKKKEADAAAKNAEIKAKEAEFNKLVTDAITEQNKAKLLQEAIDERTGVAAKRRADEMEAIRKDLVGSANLGAVTPEAAKAIEFLEKTNAQKEALRQEDTAALNAKLEADAQAEAELAAANMAAMESNRKFGEKMDAEIAESKAQALSHASDAMEVSKEQYEDIVGEMADMTPTLADRWQEASATISQALNQAFAVMSDGTKSAGEKWAALGQIVTQTLQQELVAFGITNLVKGIGGSLAGDPLAFKNIISGIAGLGGAGALALVNQAAPSPAPPLAAGAGGGVTNIYQNVEGNVTSERQLFKNATRWQDGNQRLGMAY